MRRRDFVRWARNAAGLFLLAPEELLAPRRQYWPGADFSWSGPAPVGKLFISRFVLYNNTTGEVLYSGELEDTGKGYELALPAIHLGAAVTVSIRGQYEYEILDKKIVQPGFPPVEVAAGNTITVKDIRAEYSLR